MARGTIKKLVSDRGFGFIASEDQSRDIFFHHTAVEGGMFDALQIGQSVEYEVEGDEGRGKGPRAKVVRP